jgi:multisubunit Na+/H+ antiporter MnhG subunit
VSARELAVAGLVSLAVVTAALSCLGVLAMRTPLQRLHYLGPLTMAAPLLLGAAVALARGTSSGAGWKALLIALVPAAFGPVLAHETARMAEAREEPRC